MLVVTAQLTLESPDSGVPVEGADAGVEVGAGVNVAAADAGSEAVISTTTSVAELTGAHEDGLRLHARLGFLTEWGNHPSAPLGLTLAVRVGGPNWSGVLEAWGLLPNSLGDLTGTGSLSVYSFGGIGGACYEHAVLSGALMGCVLGRGGVMRFDPRNVADLQGQWQPTVAAGVRAGGEWPRNSFVAFYVTAHAFVPIVRPYLRGENVGWTQTWVFGGAQVGFRVRLK